MTKKPEVFITTILQARIFKGFASQVALGFHKGRPSLLMNQFGDWLSTIKPDQGIPPNKFFGKHVPPEHGKDLHHVHMVPMTCPQLRETWLKNFDQWKKDSLWPQTSDRYLLFAANFEINKFLIVDHIKDPGAHALWSNRTQVNIYEKVSQAFNHTRGDMRGILSYQEAVDIENKLIIEKTTAANDPDIGQHGT